MRVLFSHPGRTYSNRQAAPELKYASGLADDASVCVFGSYLGKLRSGPAALTGFYNPATGQLLCGSFSHLELAYRKGLLTEGPRLGLLPGWYGFSCSYDMGKREMNVLPEGGVFGRLPVEHLPAFRKVMRDLFITVIFNKFTFRVER